MVQATGTEWREGYAAYMQRQQDERAMDDLRFRFRKMVDAGRHKPRLYQHPGAALMAREYMAHEEELTERQQTGPNCVVTSSGEGKRGDWVVREPSNNEH